jgi:quercetin dioxygenase-like cupin family protein
MTAPVRIDNPNGHIVFSVTSQDSGGALGVYEFMLRPHTDGPNPHVHHEITETFYVLDGELEIVHGDTVLSLGAGASATAVPHDVHAFNNRTDGFEVFHIFVRVVRDLDPEGIFDVEDNHREVQRLDLKVRESGLQTDIVPRLLHVLLEYLDNLGRDFVHVALQLLLLPSCRIRVTSFLTRSGP